MLRPTTRPDLAGSPGRPESHLATVDLFDSECRAAFVCALRHPPRRRPAPSQRAERGRGTPSLDAPPSARQGRARASKEVGIASLDHCTLVAFSDHLVDEAVLVVWLIPILRVVQNEHIRLCVISPGAARSRQCHSQITEADVRAIQIAAVCPQSQVQDRPVRASEPRGCMAQSAATLLRQARDSGRSFW
jgi:hypothetical protein